MSVPWNVGGGTFSFSIATALRLPRFQRAAVKKRGEVYRLYLSSSGPTLPPFPPNEWQVWHPFWLKRRAPAAASPGGSSDPREERNESRLALPHGPAPRGGTPAFPE